MFQKATKSQSRGRVALVGASGSGKTYTGLTTATALADGGKVAVIDTERGSASKYADIFDFDVVNLEDFSPHTYISAIQEAESLGYAVILIDSLTHAWSGSGGALEMVDKAAARARTPNSFAAWREVTPVHNALVDTMLRSKCHIIVTMRTKTEWVLEENERTKKKEPRKIGMAPIQRDGMEYEFDVVGDMDADNRLLITKTRCPALARAVIDRPTKEFGETLLAWLSDGAAVVEQPATPKPAPQPSANGKAPPKKAKTWADCATASELAKALADMKTKHPVNTAVEKWEGIYKECIGIAATRNATGAWTEESCDELNRVLDSVQSAINLETQSQEAFSG
jgi:hypothetical protein